MINTLEEMFQEIEYEELVELFEKCSSKNKDEIIQIFKEKGYEISDDCALEFLKCYEEVTPINDADLSYAAGGSEKNDCLPEFVRAKLETAIKALEDCKLNPYLEKQYVDRLQTIIDDLNILIKKPYNKAVFRKELGNIEIRISCLPGTIYEDRDLALKCIKEIVMEVLL